MRFAVSLTKRARKRKLSSGTAIVQTRYVLNYRDPKSGRRRQEFYELQKDAQARRNELIVQVGTGAYADARITPTIAEAIDHWLEDKASKVKANTLGGYKIVVAHIRGPVLVATKRERTEFTLTGNKAIGTIMRPMLG